MASWVQLYLTAALCVAFLYIPGYLVMRGVGFSRAASIPLAAIVDVLAYSVLAAAYAVVGVPSSWSSLSAPPLAIGVALIAWRALRGRHGKGSSRSSGLVSCIASPSFDFIAPRPGGGSSDSIVGRSWFDLACLGLYVAMGVGVSVLAFGNSLGSPDFFVQEYDNLHHLGITQGYLSWGNWSSFQNTMYPIPSEAEQGPFDYLGFYPSAWSCLAAMAGQLTGASAAMAENAVNFALTAVAFPVSMHCFMRTVFASRPSIVPFGAVVCLAFTAFPWALFVFGPLYPNVLAFSLLPVMAASFIAIFRLGARRKERILFACAFCLGVASCVFTQPNAVFTVGVLLVLFCVYRLACWGGSPRAPRLGVRVLLCVIFVAAVAVLWVVLFNLPFLSGVTSYWWPTVRTLPEAVYDALSASYRMDSPQIVLSLLVLVGFGATFRHRGFLWMSFSWLLACAIYVIAAACDGPFKQLVVGFWYSDSLRVASFAAIAAIPLAAMGLWLVARGVLRAAEWVRSHMDGMRQHEGRRRTRLGSKAAVVAACAVAVALGVVIYRPGNAAVDYQEGDGAFPHMISVLRGMYDSSRDNVYDSDERAFVQKVKEIVPEGEMILNVPDDGSAFAYAADGLNAYYRYLNDYDTDYERQGSRLIRNGLSSIAENDEVKEAVRQSGTEYVLLLDQGDGEGFRGRRYFFTYEDGWRWQGILSVADDTPGFEVVLSEDDMRLYRITALD